MFLMLSPSLRPEMPLLYTNPDSGFIAEHCGRRFTITNLCQLSEAASQRICNRN
jgi:hypothetical protein